MVAANTGWHGQASKVTGCERAEVHGIYEAGGNATRKPGRLLRGLDPKQSRGCPAARRQAGADICRDSVKRRDGIIRQ
jgi:hypothetical protein